MYKHIINMKNLEKEKDLEKLYNSMNTLTDLNQRSMQTPVEEESRRKDQVNDIKTRVNELKKKQEDKAKIQNDIGNALKEEKNHSDKKAKDLSDMINTIEGENNLEIKKL